MSVLNWRFAHTHESEWSSRPTVQLGPASLGSPWAYLLICRGEDPWLRVCLELDEHEYPHLEECLLWRSALWVGYGGRVCRIDPESLVVRQHRLSWYFDQFYPLEDSLLVCSASHLTRLDPDGNLLWTSPEIGLDGVLVSNVQDGIIEGQGEYDPPGGWVDFRLDLNRGELLT